MTSPFIVHQKQSTDDMASTRWAIAQLEGIGAFVASRAIFDLVNVKTGRGHRLSVTTSTTIGTPLSGSFTASDYVYFSTHRPVNFDSFDYRGARITGGSALLYSWVWLTIFDGPAYVSRELASVKITGWGLSIPGGEIGHGTTGLIYGDGVPAGAVATIPEIKLPPTPEQVDPRIHIAQKEQNAWIRIEGDALFDTGKDNIKPEAEKVLDQVGAIIRSAMRFKKYRGVLIEGHTDKQGEPRYDNKALSIRRAKSAEQWLIRKQYVAENEILEQFGVARNRMI